MKAAPDFSMAKAGTKEQNLKQQRLIYNRWVSFFAPFAFKESIAYPDVKRYNY